MSEPDKKIELGQDDSGHNHWVEVYIRYGMDNEVDSVKAVKKNSMPVFDERTYRYSVDPDGMEFVSGDKSCSGAGKSRSITPSDKTDELIRDAVEEVVA